VRVVEVDRERGRIGLRRADDPEIAGKSVEELSTVGTGGGGPPRRSRDGGGGGRGGSGRNGRDGRSDRGSGRPRHMRDRDTER
jgi:polyribonucleotide nucleotidyltransferase